MGREDSWGERGCLGEEGATREGRRGNGDWEGRMSGDGGGGGEVKSGWVVGGVGEMVRGSGEVGGWWVEEESREEGRSRVGGVRGWVEEECREEQSGWREAGRGRVGGGAEGRVGVWRSKEGRSVVGGGGWQGGV